jgi:hypothetical protein
LGEENIMARSYEPRITLGVMMDVERDTGVKTLESPGDLMTSLTNLSLLLYHSVKYAYPRLSKNQFLEGLTPEDISSAVPKLNKGLEDFFVQMRPPETEDCPSETPD